MASYGVYLAACGFEYHGPRGHIGFAPRLTPEDFRAAFTAAEGWGTFEQQIQDKTAQARITLCAGSLRVRSIALEVPQKPATVRVLVRGNAVALSHHWEDRRLEIRLAQDQRVAAGEALLVEVGMA
jgi:hypothetical protein